MVLALYDQVFSLVKTVSRPIILVILLYSFRKNELF